MLYGRLGVDFFSISDLLYPSTKNRLRLRRVRARPIFDVISDNPNVILGTVDCSLYIRRIALKVDCHRKRKDMLAYTPVKFNFLETLGKIFVVRASQNQFIHETIFKNAPVRWITIATNANCAFTGSHTENPFKYQKFDLRQIKMLRTGKPNVDIDASDNCCHYVTTMKAMNIQDDTPSFPFDNIKDQHVLVFDFTSMQDATENCHNPKLFGANI